MSRLAIIPARSGSKGLPDKNVRLLKGTPLMAYSIKAALDSCVFDEVMVSTDSERYAKTANEYGAKVPFLRSMSNSGDTAGSWEVVREVLDNYQMMGKHFDDFCLLQPTSPLRNAEDIQKAYRIFEEKHATAVVGLCECSHSPLLCNILNENGALKDFLPKDRLLRRQEFARYYRVNGAIYIFNTDEFRKNSYIYREGSYAYIMSRIRSIDIDDEEDFKMAEIFLNGGGGRSRKTDRFYAEYCPAFIRRCA